MNKTQCQIHCLPKMIEPMGTLNIQWQRRRRVKRIAKRRWNYIVNWLSKFNEPSEKALSKQKETTKTDLLQPGDMVRVKSKEEIQSTLNNWNQLKRCSFMEEMYPYCGTTQRVFKRIEKFLDERDYLLKKCKGIVILEKNYCEGTKDFGPCDRSCFFFWREEWLEKIEPEKHTKA